MKNLIKISLYLLSFTLLFTSCVDSSRKGAWTSSDINKCKSEVKVGMYEEGGEDAIDELFASLGTNVDEISACVCEKFEKEYSSFREADNDPYLINMSDEQAEEMFMSCLMTYEGEGGWSETMINLFMTNCAIDPTLEGYCSCILEEVMEKYTVAEATLLTEDDYTNFETLEDCLELID